MSTFWLVYWVSLGITIFISAFVSIFFEYEEYREKKPISLAYVLLADFIAAIPGLGILFAAILVIVIVASAAIGDLVPKENPFENFN